MLLHLIANFTLHRRERRLSCQTHGFELGRDFLTNQVACFLTHQPVGGVLAACDVQNPIGRIPDPVVAAGARGGSRGGTHQRTQRTERGYGSNIRATREELVNDPEQVICFFARDRDLVRTSVMILIGGSNQSELIPATPGDPKHDAAIRLEMRYSVIACVYSRDYDVRAAHQPQSIRVAPGAAGIHELAGLDFELFAAQRIGAPHSPARIRSETLPTFRADIISC